MLREERDEERNPDHRFPSPLVKKEISDAARVKEGFPRVRRGKGIFLLSLVPLSFPSRQKKRFAPGGINSAECNAEDSSLNPGTTVRDREAASLPLPKLTTVVPRYLIFFRKRCRLRIPARGETEGHRLENVGGHGSRFSVRRTSSLSNSSLSCVLTSLDYNALNFYRNEGEPL